MPSSNINIKSLRFKLFNGSVTKKLLSHATWGAHLVSDDNPLKAPLLQEGAGNPQEGAGNPIEHLHEIESHIQTLTIKKSKAWIFKDLRFNGEISRLNSHKVTLVKRIEERHVKGKGLNTYQLRQVSQYLYLGQGNEETKMPAVQAAVHNELKTAKDSLIDKSNQIVSETADSAKFKQMCVFKNLSKRLSRTCHQKAKKEVDFGFIEKHKNQTKMITTLSKHYGVSEDVVAREYSREVNMENDLQKVCDQFKGKEGEKLHVHYHPNNGVFVIGSTYVASLESAYKKINNFYNKTEGSVENSHDALITQTADYKGGEVGNYRDIEPDLTATSTFGAFNKKVSISEKKVIVEKTMSKINASKLHETSKASLEIKLNGLKSSEEQKSFFKLQALCAGIDLTLKDPSKFEKVETGLIFTRNGLQNPGHKKKEGPVTEQEQYVCKVLNDLKLKTENDKPIHFMYIITPADQDWTKGKSQIKAGKLSVNDQKMNLASNVYDNNQEQHIELMKSLNIDEGGKERLQNLMEEINASLEKENLPDKSLINPIKLLAMKKVDQAVHTRRLIYQYNRELKKQGYTLAKSVHCKTGRDRTGVILSLDQAIAELDEITKPPHHQYRADNNALGALHAVKLLHMTDSTDITQPFKGFKGGGEGFSATLSHHIKHMKESIENGGFDILNEMLPGSKKYTVEEIQAVKDFVNHIASAAFADKMGKMGT